MADDAPAAQNDENVNQPGYYPATDYANPYQSAWSRLHDDDAIKATLKHLNCNYMGTLGLPPTLSALKRHAQSLAVLIARLSPSVKTGVVDGNPIFDDRRVGEGEGRDGAAAVRRSVDGRLELNDAFDWLADLSRPYDNDDPSHHRPLNSLTNEVYKRLEAEGTIWNCPIQNTKAPRQPMGQRGNPFVGQVELRTNDHFHLAMHANECLELLDHEFSNTGGILSLIPEEGQASADDLKAAQNSLLGQLLLYVQSLALRNHEMDMTNAKLADALAGEAVVPMQHLSVLGPDGRSGREIAYPQDRWVLVNAGDDVWGHVHDNMDREEAALATREREWAQEDLGLGGESAWVTERTDSQRARGLVAVDVRTRFYRLQGQGRSTIFVLPAFASHPGTEWSERMDRYSRPTVVGTVAPRTVQRASMYQKRQDDDHARERARTVQITTLQAQTRTDADSIEFMRGEAARQEALRQNMAAQLAEYTARRPGEGEPANVDVIVDLNNRITWLQQQQQRRVGGIGNAAAGGRGAAATGAAATGAAASGAAATGAAATGAAGTGAAGSGDVTMSGASGP